MMSSIAWACRILSPATLHSVSGTTRCRCVTRPVAVADRWPRVVEPLGTVADHYDLPATRLVGI
jgi:hypothetical protein